MAIHVPDYFSMGLKQEEGKNIKESGTPITLIINEKRMSVQSASILSTFFDKNIVKLKWYSAIDRWRDYGIKADEVILTSIRKFVGSKYIT